MFTSAAVIQEVSFRPGQTNTSRGFSSWFKQHLALSQSISFPICWDKETLQNIRQFQVPFQVHRSGFVKSWLPVAGFERGSIVDGHC